MEVKKFIQKNNVEIRNYSEKITVGDIESEELEDGSWKFILAKIIHKNKIYTFSNIISCFNFLEGNKITVYFHNLDFDLLFFFRENEIMEGVENTPIITSGNLIISMEIKAVHFKNSLTLLPLPLKKIVEVFLKIEDKEYFNQKASIKELDKKSLNLYCTKDCIYLLYGLTRFFNFIKKYFPDLKVGSTVPSIALNIFIKELNEHQLLIHISRRRFPEFFEKGYYFGGHTEKFVNGQKVFRNVRYFDANSLYPRIMRDLVLTEGRQVKIKPSKKSLIKLFKNKEIFYAEIKIKIDSENLRFFPVLFESKHLNAYPFGEYTIKVSELALSFIEKWGCLEKNIIEVYTIISFEKGYKKIKPFRNYVDFFYSIRKSDSMYDVLCKLFLNSLYGKFGQKLIRRVKYVNKKTTEKEEILTFTKMNNGCYLTEILEHEKFYGFFKNRLDIAGKITEGGRLLMADYINQIREHGKVYYTDTDSIITNVDVDLLIPEICDDKKIGLLSDEIGYKDNIILLGLKMYHFYKSGKSATKGIKKLNLEDFKNIVRGEKNFTNVRFTKMFQYSKKGFFGIQIVPHTLRDIKERLDFEVKDDYNIMARKKQNEQIKTKLKFNLNRIKKL